MHDYYENRRQLPCAISTVFHLLTSQVTEQAPLLKLRSKLVVSLNLVKRNNTRLQDGNIGIEY